MKTEHKMPKSYIQVILAVLVFNALHLLAWELPLAVKHNFLINIYGAAVILIISPLGIFLISMKRKIGLILGLMQASWAVIFQWFFVYIVVGHTEPNGVWWYPLFTILQGLQIIYFTILILTGAFQHALPVETKNSLRSPAIYLQAISALLVTQVGQKIVREAVVGFDEGQERALIAIFLVIVFAITSAVFLIKRKKLGLWMAMFYGSLLLIQPLVYHLILGRPCYGGIWWYPFFTATQGGFIVYFATVVFRQERQLRLSI